MKENNLIASVALFSTLYNNENYNDVSDIIAEFIKGAVVSEKRWTINSREITDLLEKVYDFKIPESVVRSTVRNRLKLRADEYGHYTFKTSGENIKLEQKLAEIKNAQSSIFSSLLKFIESKTNEEITEETKLIITQNFNNYLLDGGTSDKYFRLISAFIIKNQNNSKFQECLNLIREGLILYQGIRFTADLNELGKWKNDLVIYISTEHLFNALGYNGTLFKQIFDDFHKLVSEINSNSKNKHGEKLIEIKYFKETRDEVDAFFQTAESILRNTATLDPSKTAMISILKGCKTPSDIKTKRIQFEHQLQSLNIFYHEFSQSIYSYHDFIVEDENIIEELKNQAYKTGKYFDEFACREFMRIFSKINYFRGGQSKTQFENIGCILITGNRFALRLARETKIKFNDDDIPFAKDIDFITNKFWFKLKKGLSPDQAIPKSYEALAKAQIILSAQCNQNISQQFSKLQKQFREGEFTKEEALERSYVLREKTSFPESMTSETIESALEFLNSEEFFENYFRDKTQRELEIEQLIHERDEFKGIIDERIELEQQKTRLQEQQQYEQRENEYVQQQWSLNTNQAKKDIGYSCRVLIITFLPIILTIIIKVCKPLNDYVESFGANQWYFWGFLAIIQLLELFGRAYLFNKDRVKLGWNRLLLNFNSQKYNEKKNEILDVYRKDFSQINDKT